MIFRKNLNYRKIILTALFLGLVFFVFPRLSHAQTPDIGLNYVENTGLQKGEVSDVRDFVVNIIKYLLSFLGLVAVVIIMWAGFLWMTSQGDATKIEKAKKTLINAAIGLAIIISAYAIVLFVVSLMERGVFGVFGPDTKTTGISTGFGASGNKVIESHYPARNQTDVARNSSIVITFKEPMKVADLISSPGACAVNSGNFNATDDGVENDNIKIFKATDSGKTPEMHFVAAYTCDLKTFRFKQNDAANYLGSPSENVKYTVSIGSNILKANGDKAWPSAGGGYEWTFETGTHIDARPPQISAVIPNPASSEPRNVVVQINFDEGVDPISASGDANTGTFDNIAASTLSVPSIQGYYYISNQYRTVEFITIDECGTNSCGQRVYCLPASSDISVLAKAADPDTALGGITDLAGNSLDGNMNGVPDGPTFGSPYNANAPDAAAQGDSFVWSFKTTDEIDLTPPTILSRSPEIGDTVNADYVPTALFSKIMLSSSITKNSDDNGSVALYANPGSSEVFYWFSNLNDYVAENTAVSILHNAFKFTSSYTPEFNSGARDIYQNCYNPASGPDNASGTCVPTIAMPYCCDGVPSDKSCK